MRWLRGPLSVELRERLLDRSFLTAELVEESTVQRILEQHQSGYANHGHLLWGLLSLAVWNEGLRNPPVAAIAS